MAQVYSGLRERGIDVTDDCGRVEIAPTRVTNGALAESTTDAMALYLRELRRHPLLTADEEKELAKRVEHGDAEAQGADDQLQPAAGRVDRPPLPGRVRSACST